MVQLGQRDVVEEDTLMRDLHAALPPGLAVGSYSLVQKVRAYQEAEGVGHDATERNGGHNVCAEFEDVAFIGRAVAGAV